MDSQRVGSCAGPTSLPLPQPSLPMIERVTCTPAAALLIDKLVDMHGPLMFHQSGGCCDGSAPMCFPRGEFRIGQSDVKLGDVHGQPFFMASDQFEYWKHTHLTLDVVAGRGSSFSLEIPHGVRFIIASKLMANG